MISIKVHSVSNILCGILKKRAVGKLRVKPVYLKMLYLKAAVLNKFNIEQKYVQENVQQSPCCPSDERGTVLEKQNFHKDFLPKSISQF